MDDLLAKLVANCNSDISEAPRTYQDFSINPYRELINRLFIDRKVLYRSNMGVQTYQPEEPAYEIVEILKQLDNPTFPLTLAEEKDEEWMALEKRYVDAVEQIRLEMMEKETCLGQDFKKATDAMCNVLRGHLVFRPIDEQDMQNATSCVRRRFEHARNAIRDETARKLLVLQRDIEIAGRKRRNFDKRTTETLQAWYNKHLNRPYPNDDEKAELAKQCGIKVSQVNNWFGNQRIRSKYQKKQTVEQPKPIVYDDFYGQEDVDTYSQHSQAYYGGEQQVNYDNFDGSGSSSDVIFAACHDAINYINH